MIKKILSVLLFLAIDLNARVKSTKILDLRYDLDTSTPQKKTFINKTGKKIWFQYKLINPKNGDFFVQEPVCLPGDSISFDISELGKKILPAGYGKVVMTYEVAKVTQTPVKKMDEFAAVRFRNGKKDLLISNYELNGSDKFELSLDSGGCIRVKSIKNILKK